MPLYPRRNVGVFGPKKTLFLINYNPSLINIIEWKYLSPLSLLLGIMKEVEWSTLVRD